MTLDKAAYVIASLLMVCAGSAFSAQVVELTSNPKIIGISSDPRQPYEIGDTVCFERSASENGCGTVTRLFRHGAAVELSDGADVQVGDRDVQNEISSNTDEALYRRSTASNSSADVMTRHKSSLLGKVSLGFNYPDYTTTSSSYSKLFSYLIGIGVEIPVHPAFGIETALFYSPEWVSSASSTVTAKVAVTYLEFPIYFKWRPLYRSAIKISPYILVGPSYGYLLSARLNYEGLDTPEADFTELLNSTRISLNFALGFDTAVSDELTVGFSFRYLMSVTSPARASSSSSARLMQGVVTLAWNYEDEDFFD